MVEFQSVFKSFGDKTIIEDFSYSFAPVGLYAFTGASGRGKTTMLRLISHLEVPDRGTIKSPRKIAYSFQEYRLFPNLTVQDNIELVAFEKRSTVDHERISFYLEKLCLLADRDKYPYELSGGMKQRVSLVRAFVSSSDVLLLDEPTKELDEQLAKSVVEIIQELSKTKLVIVSLHSEDFAREIGAQIIKI